MSGAARGAPPLRRRRVTLRDIAARAGVSVATASLVLRNSPLVAAATRARVQETARALGYVYDRAAAALRTGRTHTAGVAINDLANPYFARLTAAIEQALGRLGWTVFLCDTRENPEVLVRFGERLREYGAEGLILCPPEGATPATIAAATGGVLPCVQVSREVRGARTDVAGSDHRRGTALAVGHLIALGHRRIALVGAGRRTSTAAARKAGYFAALRRAGIAPDPALIADGPDTRAHGAAAVRELLQRPDPPTAVMAFNDTVAFGVMLGLRQLGLDPGIDLAVVGCDDVDEAALWTPPLTTIAIDAQGMGQAAAELFLARLADPAAPPQRVMLMPKLVVRRSCGAGMAAESARAVGLTARGLPERKTP